MNVLVEQCWSGGANYHYRFTVLNGHHKGYQCNMAWRLEGDRGWTRAAASEAKELLVRRLGISRNSVVFVHR